MSDNRFIACTACGASVSSDAYSCPQCGKPLRMRPSDIWAKVSLVFFAAGVAGILISAAIWR
jgi:predicted amidophosphoribosyltransferase